MTRTAAAPSLLGSVVAGDIAEPTVGTILQAAAQPLESDRPAHRHHDAVSLLPEPARALTRPAGTLASTLSEATPARSTGATGISVVRVVRGITGPLRLTGGPANSPLAPVTAPLVRTLRPVTGLLPHVAAPAVTAPRPTRRPGGTRRGYAAPDRRSSGDPGDPGEQRGPERPGTAHHRRGPI
jgi:hypothetical protein